MDIQIFEALGISTDIMVIVLLLLVVIELIVMISISSKYNKLSKRLSRFTTGNDAANLEQIMAKRFSEIRQIVNNEKQQNRNIEIVNEKFLTTFCKIGLVKYDAFQDTKGKLSFSLVLLTENLDGIIITSMHSREGCYTYCKEIANAQTQYTLSEEERLALDVAIGKDGAKETAIKQEETLPDIGI